MAAEETAFCPKADSHCTVAAAGAHSTDMGTLQTTTSYYYSSFEESSVPTTVGDALPAPTPESEELETPSGYQRHPDDSSDHEREGSDGESFYDESSSFGNVQLLGGGEPGELNVRGVEAGKIQCPDKDSAFREDVAKLPPCTVNCALIPSCAIRHSSSPGSPEGACSTPSGEPVDEAAVLSDQMIFLWSKCRLFYILVIVSLLLIISTAIVIGVFWSVQVIKYRSQISTRQDLSTSAVYELTSDFPLGHIYSNQLCLTVHDHVPTTTLYVNKIAYVTLKSEECESVSVFKQEVTVTQDDAAFSYNYMFYWLNNTILNFQADAGISSRVSIILLDNKESFDWCTNHILPSDYVMKWNFDFNDVNSSCSLVPSTGRMVCLFYYALTKSGYYYLCVNSTIQYDLRYNLSISTSQYNTSLSRMAVQCTPERECCLDFQDLFSELSHPTCMFVSTTPLAPAYSWLRLSDVEVRVDQRLSVLMYCGVACLPVLLMLGCVLLLCSLTSCKVKNPSSTITRGCVLHCNIYSNNYNNTL